ncbi:unnamed protein product [Haemonchus placei]|uniref:Uncharacterized protein n=1 Tax=Haemonchus placei TaxID=6290 RepID=A0A0N4WUC2_HAEPC|nr:unnamed protein product [Haemonchus placei]
MESGIREELNSMRSTLVAKDCRREDMFLFRKANYNGLPPHIQRDYCV